MRTPSLTLPAAFQACVDAYGKRDETPVNPVNSSNREHVKKWLVARGLPGAYVRGLTIAELHSAWFDRFDTRFDTLVSEARSKGFTVNVNTDHSKVIDVDASDVTATMDDDVTFTVTKHIPPDAEYAPGPVVPSIDETPTEESTDMSIQNDNVAANDSVAAAAAALAEALARTQGKGASVDAEQVREIVREEVEKVTLPRRVDVVINDVKKGELPALRHNKVELLMKIIAQKVYAFVVGGAGSGKTTMGEQIASALDLTLYIQGAMSGDHQLIGWKDAAGNYHTTPFRECFEKGGLIILDEFDGCTDPSVPLVVNAALANGYMTFPDSPLPIKRHEDFHCIVCANTFGTGADRSYNGRTQLDAATLDRFFYVVADYDEELEAMLPGVNKDWLRRVLAVRHAVAKLSMRHVISPRATLMGSKLLAAGLSQFEVEAGLLWKGLSDADRTKIENAIGK